MQGENVIYKAQIIHPYTNVPLIVSFNTKTHLFSFERDEEVIAIMKKIRDNTPSFFPNLFGEMIFDQSENICKYSYPANSLEDVYELLEQLGIEREKVKFVSYPLQ